MEELGLCPFCGSKAGRLEPEWSNLYQKKLYGVHCTNVGCVAFNTVPDFFRQEIADAAWNRRATPENKPLICPLLSDDEVKQPCLEGPCPAILNEPLTMEQLRKMTDKRVWTQFHGLGMYGLVAYHSDPDGDDGDDVYITNNLGGRSTYEEILRQGGEIFPRKPEWSGD